MPSSPLSPPSETAADAALAWLLRLNSGETTAAERRAFETWLAARDEHRRAFEEVQRLWNDADYLRQDPRTGLIAPACTPQRRVRACARKRQRQRWHWAGAALALGILVAVLQGGGWRLAADHAAGTAPEIVTLADGSTLHLDADSAVSIDMTEARRRIVLHQGEAWFRVAADPKRPFQVVSGDVSVTALGTEFLVKRRDQGAYVAVTEHSVEVVEDRRKIKVGEGQSLTVGAANGEWRPEPFNPNGAGAWRSGKLVVQDRPLGEVVADLSRYRPGWIVVASPALARQHVNGVFDIAQTEKAVATLSHLFNLRQRSVTPYLLVLSPE